MTSALQELQERFGSAVEGAIADAIAQASLPRPLTGMLEYQLGYVGPDLLPVNAPTGKRFRPLLCLLACEAVGGDPRDALPAAAAIELVHNFSLIHDDIEDRDSHRRHRPTVWKVWGEPQAINAGDAMFALAGERIACSTTDLMLARTLAHALQRMCLDLTVGQYWDMSFETREDVTEDEYLAMISRKTGAIIAYSTWAGALLGGGTEETAQTLAEFGRMLGRAFQIRDDIHGIWADQSVTGKQQGKDIANRKKTLPVLLAWGSASEDDAAILHRYYTGESDDTEPVYCVLERTDAARRSGEAVSLYRQAAIDAVGRAPINQAAFDVLRRLTDDLTL